MYSLVYIDIVRVDIDIMLASEIPEDLMIEVLCNE